MSAPTAPKKFWIATLSAEFSANPPQYKSPPMIWMKGQLEKGENTHFTHWQFVFALNKPQRLSYVSKLLPHAHLEPTRSAAANEYVFKDETCVDIDTRFEFGDLPFKRNSKVDWQKQYSLAKKGLLDDMDPSVLIKHYGNVRRIQVDNIPLKHRGIQTVNVFIGGSGLGKSRRAWHEAEALQRQGLSIYEKMPDTKWWDGYSGEQVIVLDEFTGKVSIGHLLRWFDRYPCKVEYKGGCTYLATTHWFITTNLPLDRWFSDITPEHMDALKRRVQVTIFQTEWSPGEVFCPVVARDGTVEREEAPSPSPMVTPQ